MTSIPYLEEELKTSREELEYYKNYCNRLLNEKRKKDSIIQQVINDLEFLITPARTDNSFHNNPIYVLEMTKILSILQGSDKEC